MLRAARATLLLGALAFADAGLASAQQTRPYSANRDAAEDAADEVQPRGFAIPQTREAANSAQRALEHVAAGRASEAIAALQEMIVSRRGEVLVEPGAQPEAAERFVGAVDWARRQLAALPPETLQLYRTRNETQTRVELESALARRDAKALAELARRFPQADAAVTAWRALGDLELERNDLLAAEAAWRRAAELESALDAESGPGADLRKEQLKAWRATEPKPQVAAPGPNAATWAATLAPENAAGPFGRGDTYCLYPCVEGDAVYVTDTLRVWAFDAWSGERRWISKEPEAWTAVDRGLVNPTRRKPLRREDLFEKVDRSQLIARPACNGGVVVAAIQAPFTQVGNENYQQFEITSPMPERRLFAYDAATGAELWNHLPPPLWDGESGSFQERMSVSAAPTVVGSRVFVASHRMRGRIDFHVACYDLYDGRLLWSTPLVSGQVELNMFGRPLREYTAAPITVADERVFVATQLGAVAALDLFSGDILWETLYEQIPVPRANHWNTEIRRQYWSNAAPIVADDVVLVSPSDSRELIALDTASGARLWRREHENFGRGFEELTLLGARGDSLWLSNDRILLARAARGLRNAAGPTLLDQSVELFNTTPRPRPALSENLVIAASGARRVALDRQRLNEDRRASADWAAGQYAGNVALADGAAYFLAGSRLSAAVDWRVVSERFAKACAAAPDDPAPHIGWASVLMRRGSSELASGESENAARTLQDAASRLEPFLEHEDSSVRADARRRFVAAALGCSDALMRNASLRNAWEWAQRACGVAESKDDLASALLRRVELEAALRRLDERRATLVQLDERCGDMRMPSDWLERDDAERYANTASPVDRSRMTVGAFVLLEQALDARRDEDAPREFACLHEVLARYGDLRLPVDALRPRDTGSAVSARIGALIDSGARAAYAPYERAAAEWLERARANDDFAALEALADRYPHSRAALEAERSRMEAALARADLPTVVQLAMRAIPDEWNVVQATPEQLHAQLVLRAALEDAGNHEFAAGLCARLESVHGAFVSPLARDGGKSISQLREASAARAQPPEAPTTTFASSSIPPRPQPGSFLLLGRALVSGQDGAQEWAQILCRRDRNLDIISAWGAASTERPLWSAQTSQGAALPGWSAASSAGALVLGNRNSLLALDASTGDTQWSWNSGAARIDSFRASDGVVLVVTTAGERGSLVAIDARLGLELWARPIPVETWARPVVGGGQVVLLPSDFAQSPALIIDLFTGARTGTVTLPAHVGLTDVEGAWIEQGKLILPSFPKSSAATEQECVSAWDLPSGRRAWRVLCEAHQEFDSIVRADGRTYLVLLPRATAGRAANGAVLDLDLKLGAVRRVQNAAVRPTDVLVGVGRHRVVECAAPYLFLRGETDDGATTLLRALHLPYGERWSAELEVPPTQLQSSGPMPPPVVSDRSVTVFYTPANRAKATRGVTSTIMVVLDRDTGAVQERSGLPMELGSADKLECASLGGTLWIAGLNLMLIRRSR